MKIPDVRRFYIFEAGFRLTDGTEVAVCRNPRARRLPWLATWKRGETTMGTVFPSSGDVGKSTPEECAWGVSLMLGQDGDTAEICRGPTDLRPEFARIAKESTP